jgi:5-methylcytosine-specific restriction endonuclease McrA
MAVTSLVHGDLIAKLVRGGTPAFAQLSDDELLANTRRLVGKSNQLLAALLAHLGEVDARGVHRSRRCSSLYTYCIYELRFSEDAAARRSAAARFAKEFPALLEAIAAGELHLTGLLMLGPHLTPANQAEVLARAKFRTKKELTKLVRELNPLPSVPDLVEPLGLVRERMPANPTWAQVAASLSPSVRELPEAERPDAWANDRIDHADEAFPAPALPVGPVPSDLLPVTGPQHFLMQFATVEEHVHLVERAKALLARRQPTITLGELHREAMKLLVHALEQQKFSVTRRTNKLVAATPQGEPETETETKTETETERELGPAAPKSPRQRGRYVPAAVRREVYRRDGARCAYVDARGERCRETHYLELHHLQPFAKGGAHAVSNLTLRCAAHNALAAEHDFGANFMAELRSSARHEALAAQACVDAERGT